RAHIMDVALEAPLRDRAATLGGVAVGTAEQLTAPGVRIADRVAIGACGARLLGRARRRARGEGEGIAGRRAHRPAAGEIVPAGGARTGHRRGGRHGWAAGCRAGAAGHLADRAHTEALVLADAGHTAVERAAIAVVAARVGRAVARHGAREAGCSRVAERSSAASTAERAGFDRG